MFFVIGLLISYVLPCFATGCHTFTFKIATAALRPRNDTKIGMFLFGKRTFFIFAAIFCAVSPRISSFKRYVPEFVPFSRKTYQICHCEEGACARRGNL